MCVYVCWVGADFCCVGLEYNLLALDFEGGGMLQKLKCGWNRLGKSYVFSLFYILRYYIQYKELTVAPIVLYVCVHKIKNR